MGTIQAGSSPGGRIDVGDSVLQAAKKTNTKPIAERLSTFAKVHAAYVKSDAEVKAASVALQTQQATIAEADVDQDACVQGLASALVGEGLPRANPFKAIGYASPSDIAAMGYAKEAAELLKLATTAAKRKDAGKALKAAAAAARAAAKRVLAAIKPIARLEKVRRDAIARRDALDQPWETAFAALKRGARAAEDDGARGIFNALFVRASAKKAKPAAKRGSKAPVPT